MKNEKFIAEFGQNLFEDFFEAIHSLQAGNQGGDDSISISIEGSSGDGINYNGYGTIYLPEGEIFVEWRDGNNSGSEIEFYEFGKYIPKDHNAAMIEADETNPATINWASARDHFGEYVHELQANWAAKNNSGNQLQNSIVKTLSMIDNMNQLKPWYF